MRDHAFNRKERVSTKKPEVKKRRGNGDGTSAAIQVHLGRIR